MNAYFCAPMKIRILSLFVLLCAVIVGCESDFDLTTDWKEISVVYGMLDINESTHYLRVHKAFIDENVSGSDIALIADSAYHEGEIQVDLIQLNPSGNNIRFNCERVLAADEGITMEPITADGGAFATEPYYLYKTEAQLDNEKRYRVEILRNEAVIANSEMGIIGELEIINPNILIDPLPALNLMAANPFRVKWLYAENGEIYDVNMTLTYKETLSSGGEEIKELVFPLATNKFPTDDEKQNATQMSVDIGKDYIFSHLLANIEANPFIEREALHLDFSFTVGGLELRAAQESADAQAGITSSQAITLYTNVFQGNTQVEPAAGLFTSRFDSLLNEIPVNNRTKDTLHCHPLMQSLNWKPHTPTVICN